MIETVCNLSECEGTFSLSSGASFRLAGHAKLSDYWIDPYSAIYGRKYLEVTGGSYGTLPIFEPGILTIRGNGVTCSNEEFVCSPLVNVAWKGPCKLYGKCVFRFTDCFENILKALVNSGRLLHPPGTVLGNPIGILTSTIIPPWLEDFQKATLAKKELFTVRTPMQQEHPDKTAFLKALRANPDDETLRLVFADWCEEHGEDEMATRLRAAKLENGGLVVPGVLR